MVKAHLDVVLVAETLAVPFRETPSYTKRRRLIGVGGLSSPRLLQRSASDNNLKAESRPSYSPVPSLRSLPQQLLAQMQEVAVGAGVGDSSLVSTSSSGALPRRCEAASAGRRRGAAAARPGKRPPRGRGDLGRGFAQRLPALPRQLSCLLWGPGKHQQLLDYVVAADWLNRTTLRELRRAPPACRHVRPCAC
uniref:Uncharacterized protein n=1 Tax=Sphaerodactylus townsendi TaxID=933632 RepID=A0ACB8FMX1_9SAUR